MYQITNNCVGCHQCAVECPVGAIGFVGAKYEIHQEACIGCGKCARVCHTASIVSTDPAPVPAPHDPIVREADVVVCGAGSGLIAAVRAAMAGKKVILLEKADRLGGNTDFAHGFFPIYTKWHQEAGMPDCREDAIRHYLNATGGELEEEVLRTAVYSCGEFFDWLCQFGGCENVFRLINMGEADVHGPIYGTGLIDFPHRVGENLKSRDESIGPGWSGTFVKNTMLNAIRTRGLVVEILTRHAARHLLTDEAGAVTGVIADDPGGQTRINAPVVILATGGFGKSDEKIREYFPTFFENGPVHRFSVPTDTGDGIDMLRELGVEPNPQRLFVSVFGPKHHPFNNVLADIALEPEMLQVNLNGVRWVDETLHLHGMSPYIAAQPQSISWAVQSLDNIEMIAQRFIDNPAFANKVDLYLTWKEDLEAETQLDLPVKKADTLEELARKCGMPEDAFVSTIREYNSACAAGTDTAFGKDGKFLRPVADHGPYYAIYGQRFSECAMGGLMVDGQCRVLRNDGSHIPGLYGAGDATSAMHRRGKLAVISELTWAVASAYASAGSALDYLSGSAQ